MDRQTQRYIWRKEKKAIRKNRTAKLVESLGGICVMCGINDNLEFDHIDPASKKFVISMSIDKPWLELVDEAKKCQLLCRPCHIHKTRDAGEYKGGHNKIMDDAYTHGTPRMYFYKRCSCCHCLYARRLYRAKKIKIDDVVIYGS